MKKEDIKEKILKIISSSLYSPLTANELFELTCDGEEHFVFTVNVAVSPMFLSWVMGFGELAQILHPQSAINSCKKLCEQVSGQY